MATSGNNVILVSGLSGSDDIASPTIFVGRNHMKIPNNLLATLDSSNERLSVDAGYSTSGNVWAQGVRDITKRPSTDGGILVVVNDSAGGTEGARQCNLVGKGTIATADQRNLARDVSGEVALAQLSSISA